MPGGEQNHQRAAEAETHACWVHEGETSVATATSEDRRMRRWENTPSRWSRISGCFMEDSLESRKPPPTATAAEHGLLCFKHLLRGQYVE